MAPFRSAALGAPRVEFGRIAPVGRCSGNAVLAHQISFPLPSSMSPPMISVTSVSSSSVFLDEGLVFVAVVDGVIVHVVDILDVRRRRFLVPCASASASSSEMSSASATSAFSSFGVARGGCGARGFAGRARVDERRNRHDLAGVRRNHRILAEIVKFAARGRADAFGTEIWPLPRAILGTCLKMGLPLGVSRGGCQ